MSSVLTSPSSITREAQLRALLEEYGFAQTHMNALKLYNAHQPYHNWHHCALVALNAVEAARQMNVPVAKQRLLLLAGLYHDYDHTGEAAKADIFNIARAVSGSAFWLGVQEPGLSQAEKNEIANLIAATEVSHVQVPRTMFEDIMLDADVLASTGADREQWWAALGEELDSPVDAASTLVFLRVQNFCTLWGMQRSKAVIQELQALVPPQRR